MGLTALEAKRVPLRSTAASVALHVLMALAIPSFALTFARSPQIETISFTKISFVHISTPRPVVRSQPPAAAPVRRAEVHLQPKRSVPQPHAVRRAPVTVARHASVSAQSAPLVAAAVQGSVAAASQPTDAPKPIQSDAPRQVASVQHHGPPGGYLPLGAQQEVPVLDPAVRSAIAALGIHTTVTVVVDEDGKTKSVTFSPDLDAGLESKIRDMLTAAEWDPSVCGGGVSCQGQAVIKF